MPMTIYQHYVPQVYLRAFSFDQNHIYVYDMETNHGWVSLIRNVGGQNYLYDALVSDANDFAKTFTKFDLKGITQTAFSNEQKIEQFFAIEIEGKIYNSIKQVLDYFEGNEKIEVGVKLFDEEAKAAWAAFGVYQYLRTPSSKETFDSMIKSYSDQSLVIIRQFEKGYQIKQPKITNHYLHLSHPFIMKLRYLEMLINPEIIGDLISIHLKMYIWLIEIAPAGKEFFTSDHPCIFGPRYHKTDNPLFLPISPKLCFMLLPKKKYQNEFTDLSFYIAPEGLVEIINTNIVNYAERFIFSNKQIDVQRFINLIKNSKEETS